MSAQAALAIGAITAVGCYFGATSLKRWFKYDDSLDAFGIHGVGVIIGAVLTGVFVSTQISGVDGSVLKQLAGVLITVLYSGVVSVLLLKLIALFCGGLRVDKDDEREGLDVAVHGERVE